MVIQLKSLFRFLNRLLVAAAVIFGLVFIRLAYGPTPVDFMAPYMTRPFQEAFPDQTLSFDGVFLTWNMSEKALEFVLENAVITGSAGDVRASFPRIAVDFSGAHMLVGDFIPERVDLYGAEIKISWSAAHFEAKVNRLLSGEDDTPDDPLEKPPVIRFMETLLKGEGENSALKNLKVVNIREATVTLEERETGVIWTMPDGNLSLARTPLGLALNADLRFYSEEEVIRIKMRSANTAEGLTRTDLEVQGLNVTNLAAEVGLGGIFEAVNMPLYGTVTLWQNATGGVSRVGFDIGGGPGTIFFEVFQSAPSAFEDVVFKGTLEPEEKLISIDLLRLEVGGAVIEGDGFLQFEEEETIPAVRMVISGENLSIPTLLKLWPQVPYSGGRTWIEANVEGGVLNHIQGELVFDPEIWKTRPLPENAMHITMDFADGDIYFLRPMPGLLGASGTITINGNSLSAVVLEGTVDGIKPEVLTFDIEDLTTPQKQMGHAMIRMEADLQKVLKLVDNEPLLVFSKIGLDPEEYSGDISGVARIDMPLILNTKPEDTVYTIEATVTKAVVPSLISDGGLTDGTLTMTVTPAGLVANGHGNLRDAPFDFYWTEDFLPDSDDSFTTRVELSGNLTGDNLHRFGMPEDVVLEGKARVYVSLRGLGGELKQGQGSVDFFNAGISAVQFDWYKDPNRPAEGTFDLEWSETNFYVRNAEITSREFAFKAEFIFDAESGLMKHADVPLFISGKNDLTITARQDENAALEVTVQARSFNASPFLETMFEETGEESFAPDMKMTFYADRIYAMNDVILTNVSISAEKNDEYWISANLIGAIDDGGAFQVAIEYNGEGRHLKVESDNAGRFVLGTNIFRNGVGGVLDLEADLSIYTEPLYATGVLNVRDLTMVKSSVLIQALAEEEKSGLDEMISDDGILMKKINIPFTLENKIIDISGATARAASMGLTMEGQVDQDFERMNLNGMVVPAYTLNTILSHIPILGTILMGGKGEGLFALNYRISGTREDPKVDFNPISALTPGILRKLFANKKGELEPLDADEPPAEEEPAENPATADVGEAAIDEGEDTTTQAESGESPAPVENIDTSTPAVAPETPVTETELTGDGDTQEAGVGDDTPPGEESETGGD